MNELVLNKLVKSLNTFGSITDETFSLLRKHIQVIHSPKRSCLVQVGQAADTLYFVGSGLVRGYYHQKGRDVTTWVLTEGNFIAPTYDFLTRQISAENVETLENSVLLGIHYPTLRQLCETRPDLRTVDLALMTQALRQQQEQIRMLKLDSASERYYFFCAHNPVVSQRATNQHIASYLGISKYTLSRLRGQKINHKFIINC